MADTDDPLARASTFIDAHHVLGKHASGAVAVIIDLAAALRELEAELATTLELLRQHALDWGDCDEPATCSCSHARSLQKIAEGEQ